MSERLAQLLDKAELALGEGRLHDAEQHVREALVLDERSIETHYMLGEILRDQGRLDESEGAYRFVALNSPENASGDPSQASPYAAEGWAGLASVLLDQLRWDEASKAANRSLRENPMCAEGAWVRAILRERRADYTGALRDYLRAWRSDPVSYPLPVPLDDETVEELTIECLEMLHPTLKGYLVNVPIILEEVPSEELLRQYDPPAPPTGILGFFSGSSLQERSLDNPWSVLPGAIVLFRRNLSRIARSREDVLEELRVTLFHEVGHFLGLSEEDLEDRGLD
jgi:predicted Zn-dependent protease with MMP-like domain